MIVLRAFAFLCFILLLAGAGVWQFTHLWQSLADFGHINATLFVLAGAPLMLAAMYLVDAKLRGNARLGAFAVAGLATLPATALVAGVLHLIMGGGFGRRVWTVALTVGALLGFNIVGALLAGMALAGGGTGLALGVTCVKLQFFLVADYFLCRAVVHYFTSGASAFVSLRYLRRRVISLLSVIGIAIGVLVLILVNSVMSGFQHDFREQVRGSLSHLLVKFDSDRLHPGVLEQERLEWAEYVRRIEADPDLRREWDGLLAAALEAYRADPAAPKNLDENRDILPDPRPFLPGQPPGEAPPAADAPRPKDASEREFIRRLRMGERMDRLRTYLRRADRPVTPREIYLPARAPANSQDREAFEAEIRDAWFYPAFSTRIKREFLRADETLRRHQDARGQRDVSGVSWRVFTKTFITPRYVTADLPIAELVGVDVARETEISDLGTYVAAAEIEAFKRRYVLGPLQQALGATLGFETAQSAERAGLGAFNYASKGGEGIPRDMARQLKLRRLTASSDKVLFNEFDAVRFWPASPGQAIYERAKQAYKAATRTQDTAALRRILADFERDLRVIIERELARAAPATEEEAAARVGCLHIRDFVLTGAGASDNLMRRLVSEYHDAIALMSRETDLSQEEGRWLGALALRLREATEARKEKITSPQTGETEREEALRALVNDYSTLIAQALKQSADLGYLAHFKLKDNLRLRTEDQPLDPAQELPFSPGAFLPRAMPLAYASALFDARLGAVTARQAAYRKSLPLRTAMREDESADEYFARATRPGQRPGNGELPGVILGDALAESAYLGGAQVGDTIALTIPRIYRDDSGRLVPRAIEARFTITAFFRSGLYEDNFGRIYCDFDELSRLMSDSETRYVVGARLLDYSPYEGDAASQKLKREVTDALRRDRVNFVSVGVWEDEKRSLLEAVNREKAIIGLIVAFILFLAGVLIIIVVYQLVSEKVKDIGILKALGHSPWGIRSVFMFNALFIGLFGAVVGCALGIAASEYLNQIEDIVDQLTGVRLFPPEIYYLTYIPSLKGRDLFMLALDISVPAVLWSFGCGILPALAAARKDPIEALHNE